MLDIEVLMPEQTAPDRGFLKAAFSLGFVAAGVAPAGAPPFHDELLRWLAAGRHGRMKWFEKNLSLRLDPSGLLEDCRTVISLAYPYGPEKPCTPDGFSVARYSEPLLDDYHARLKSLAGRLSGLIEQAWPGSRTRVCVDSAPVMERSFAMAAGVGFIGKNTSLIVPGVGSFVYLAEILTTAPIEATAPLEERAGSCGECTRCLDACPTGALEAPYHMDASRCLSYLTIEDRDPVDAEIGKRMGSCILGCDRCQEVCPHNGDTDRRIVCLPSLPEIERMDKAAFKARFGRTALARAGIRKLRENIAAVTAAGAC